MSFRVLGGDVCHSLDLNSWRPRVVSSGTPRAGDRQPAARSWQAHPIAVRGTSPPHGPRSRPELTGSRRRTGGHHAVGSHHVRQRPLWARHFMAAGRCQSCIRHRCAEEGSESFRRPPDHHETHRGERCLSSLRPHRSKGTEASALRVPGPPRQAGAEARMHCIRGCASSRALIAASVARRWS